MTTNSAVSRPTRYRTNVGHERVSSPYTYGGYDEDYAVEEPVNAVTYSSSYAKHNVSGVDYGLWANSNRLDSDNFWDTVMEDEEHVWVVAFIDPMDKICQKFVT